VGAKRVGIACLAVCLLLAGAAAASGPDLRLIDASKRDDAPAVKALVGAGVNVNARPATARPPALGRAK